MVPGNPKAGQRRLVNMSPDIRDAPWEPELPAVDEWEQDWPIDDTRMVVIRCEQDRYGRLTEWAVILLRKQDGEWRNVAVFDSCHTKGFHLHYVDKHGARFREDRIGPINSYDDLERCMDEATERVCSSYEEIERVSDGGG